jgi:hypothetical protein
MRSYAQPLQFGISVVPCADSLERIRELVRVSDEAASRSSLIGQVLPALADHFPIRENHRDG